MMHFSKILSGLFVAMLSSAACAQTLTWTGAANGTTFGIAGNWSPAGIPGPNSDCVIPAGAGTVVIGNNTSVRSLTTARNLFIEGCVNIVITGGLHLDAGVVAQIDNTGGRTAFSFSGGSQSISGSGTIFISSEGGNGKAISAQSNATLTIDGSISIGYGPGATGTSAQIYVEAGSAIINNGGIASGQSGATLSIAGAGNFVNNGTLSSNAGTLTLQTASWTNNGAIHLASSAIARLSGSFSSLGTILNSGGSVSVFGPVSSAILTASSDTGAITLSAATLTSCTLQSTDTTGFLVDGVGALNACAIGADVVMGSCAKVVVTNSLTFVNGGSFTNGPDCVGTPLLFSGTQSIHGDGTIYLRRDSTASERSLTVTGNASLTIDPGISIVATSGTGSPKLLVDANCSLTNNGTIAADSGTFTIDATAPNSSFLNAGAINIGAAAVAEIKATNWINSGALVIDSAKLTISDSWTNSGTILATGSTVIVNGVNWINSGSATFISSAASFWSTNWTNAAQLTSAYGTLEFRGTWSNPGVVTTIDSAVMLAGTTSVLGTIDRSGGTITLAQANFQGPTLVANAQTGDLILSSVTITGATLSATQGAQFIVHSPRFANCTLACDLAIPGSYRLAITGDLTLANNVTITLGSPIAGGNAGGLAFDGGSQSITGAGTILARYSPTLLSYTNAASVTLGPAVTLALGSNAQANTLAQINVPTGSSFTNQGTIAVRQSGCTMQFYGGGLFKNEGILDAAAGTLDIDNFSGSVGVALIAAGGSLQLQGNFTIDQPIDSHGALSLAGTWRNNSTVTVTGGSLNFSGTWTNAGTFALTSSPWTISGIYSSLGNITTVSSPQTYFGRLPTGTVITADASTGDIFLNQVTLANSTLRASDGAVFRIAAGGLFLNLNGCTLVGSLLAGTCCNITLSNGFTLANGASLSLESGASCGPAILYVSSGSQTIGGCGEIDFRNLNVATSGIQIQNNASLTIASGVSLVCPSNSRQGGSVSIGPLASLTNFGRFSMQMPATSLVVGGTGAFRNSGTIESLAGSTVINPTTLQNYDGATFTLSGGKWLAQGGSLTLGSRTIRTIAADTELAITGLSNSIPTISTLLFNDGTLRLASRTLTLAPPNHLFTNTGLIDLAPDAVLAITGELKLTPTATVRTAIKGGGTAQFGRIKPSTAATVAGHLRGAFVAPYAPAAGTIFTPVIFGSPIGGAFSDVCFDDNPQRMGVTQDLIPFQMRLIASTASGISPAITQQPQNASAQPDAVFSVLAAPNDAQYQWRKGGIPLSDGPTPSGSTIAGSQTGILTIHVPHKEDVGSYDVIAANSCGSTTSTSASLTICSGDLNYDGLVDDADFQLFVGAYNLLDCADSSMPAGCPSDLNADGVVDDADFQAFVPAYNELLCP
ncbi:MAG: hypothetical protein ACREJD_07915 [Phycisphaerales bacterium]